MIVLGVPDTYFDHRIHQRDAQGNFSLNLRKTECPVKFLSRFFQNFHGNYLYIYTLDSQKSYSDIQALLRKAPAARLSRPPCGRFQMGEGVVIFAFWRQQKKNKSRWNWRCPILNQTFLPDATVPNTPGSARGIPGAAGKPRGRKIFCLWGWIPVLGIAPHDYYIWVHDWVSPNFPISDWTWYTCSKSPWLHSG